MKSSGLRTRPSQLAITRVTEWLVAFDEDLANRIREILGSEPGLGEQKMFGGLAFLINGNMSVAASREGGLLLRVDPEQTDRLLARAHAAPFVMRNRPMDGWLRIHPDGVRTKRDLERWARIGVDYARSLPSKPKAKGASGRGR